MKKMYACVFRSDVRHSKMLKIISSSLCLLLFFSWSLSAAPEAETNTEAQEQSEGVVMTGTVVDDKGIPLPGVNVVIQGTSTGVITNENGKYSIKVKRNDALRFSFIGFKPQVILVEGKESIDVKLQSSEENLEEVQVVAFGEQKKESVVGSITTVKASDLQSSNSDLTSSFAGKISGVIGWDVGGAPGALTEDEMNTKFYIRGITSYATGANVDPLILLDGIEVSKLDLARIDPDDIESFNVMKDASATAMYGARGANGVIYVKTKKGEEGNVRTTLRYERIYSMPTDEIDVVSPQEWMQLYNKASMGRGYSDSPQYSKEDIDRIGDPRFPSYVYPGVDWYDVMFKDHSVNNHYGLTVRGGGAKVQYYASLVHNRNNGMLKTDALNEFDTNITNEQTNIRLNLNVNLNKSSKLNANTYTTYDKYHGTVADTRQIYGLAFNASPIRFAPVYPADSEFNWPHTRFGGTTTSYNGKTNSYDNPYAEVHKGYSDRTRYTASTQFEWIQYLDKFVKGLELRLMSAFTKTGFFSNSYTTTPAIYTLGRYDHATGDFRLKAENPDQSDNKLAYVATESGSRSSSITDFQARLLHTAAWDEHQTSGTLVMTTRNREESNPTSLEGSLPYRNISISGRATYGYRDKYFVDATIGINGSERFAEGNRIGYFPAIGAAWVFSKENFMRASSKWLTYGKLRASYGVTGNDGVIGNPRFLYLEQISNPFNVLLGPTDQSKQQGLMVKSYAKENTKWETNEQLNFGLDLKLFGGIFETNIDAYRSIRHNIYDYRWTIPSAVGLPQPPLDNYGSVLSQGIDFSGKVQHAFSSDLWLIVNGTVTYNQAEYLDVEEPTGAPEWQRKKGHHISQEYAFIAEGLFQDQQEIDNAPTQSGSVQPGDIRYKDIDGNGVIDINDRVLVGHPQVPALIYGLNLFAHYKQFEFSMAFQGSGNRSFFLNPTQISPLAGDRAVLREIANSHWSPDNQQDRPFWPKLSINNIAEHNKEELHNPVDDIYGRSTYFLREGKFVRCTNIELAYYLKKDWIKKAKIENFRLFARANNPFLISDFNLWDIELGGNGFSYPIQKTYSIGMNFSF